MLQFNLEDIKPNEKILITGPPYYLWPLLDNIIAIFKNQYGYKLIYTDNYEEISLPYVNIFIQEKDQPLDFLFKYKITSVATQENLILYPKLSIYHFIVEYDNFIKTCSVERKDTLHVCFKNNRYNKHKLEYLLSYIKRGFSLYVDINSVLYSVIKIALKECYKIYYIIDYVHYYLPQDVYYQILNIYVTLNY